ncbi:MAG: protein kinase [Planctomycetales bacterium]|nr:protein kinase [Planctomycetales bacterium]
MTTLDDLLCLWEENREAGIPVSPEDLCAETPELLQELKWTIRALEAVESRFGVISTQQEQVHGAEVTSHRLEPSDTVLVSSEYRIEELHASGGLGSVYIATDPVLNRRVAIKFPRWKNLTAEQSARFEREARVTGRLDHPGIIPVHALKSNQTDRPCYVMRFVDGQTLQARIHALHAGTLDSKPASFYDSHEFRQLLQNLVTVCNIVAYAHGQGVIHRDIKPANIILGPFGEVLLLDWGLAKVHGETSDDPASVVTVASDGNYFETHDGQVLGTPAFASPEQLLGHTENVTVVSDVYALGATLFALLTGSYSIGKSAFHEHLDRLKLGQRFSAHEVNPAIPVALEAICCHAMEIRRADRYVSAVSMAQDIERYLAGESVSVCRDSTFVRLGRWIRRRPGLAAASATGVLIASLAGAAGAVVLGQKNQELQSNNEKLELAMEDSRSANVQALQALRTLFDDIVAQKLGSQAELTDSDREFLQKILQQYETFASLKGDSIESRVIRAEGLQQSGTILLQLSEEQEARARFEAAAKIYQKLLEETDQADYRRQLASTLVDVGLSMQNFGELAAAEQAANEGLAVLAPVLVKEAGASDPVAWEAFANLKQLLGGIQIAAGRMEEALVSFGQSKDVLEKRRASDPESHETLARLAESYRAMSDACQQLGDIAGQEDYSHQALALYRVLVAKFPDNRRFSEGFTWACYDRSYAHEFFERNHQAIEEMTEAVELAGKLAEAYPLSDEFRGVLGGMQIRRGAIHARMGHLRLAEKDLKNAVALFEKMIIGTVDGAQSYRQLLKADRLLAMLQYTYGQFEESEATLRKAKHHAELLAVSYPETAAQSWEIHSLPYDLAMLLADRGQLADAETELQNGLAAAEAKSRVRFERIHAQSILQSKCGLVKLKIWGDEKLRAKEFTDVASAFLQELEEDLPESSPDWDIIAEYHLQLANFYDGLGDLQGASAHMARHLPILNRIAERSPYRPTGKVTILNALIERGDILAEKGDYRLARQQLEEAENTVTDAMKSYPGEVSLLRSQEEVNWARGRLLFGQQDYAGAMRYFDEAIRLNPASRHRSIRFLCMGLCKDSRTLSELKVEVNGTVHCPSLPDQIRSCGAMVKNNSDTEQVSSVVAVATLFINKAHADNVFLKPSILKRLRSSAEYRELCKHQDLSGLVDQLDPAKLPAEVPSELPQ